jgi:hypothetical protein
MEGPVYYPLNGGSITPAGKDRYKPKHYVCLEKQLKQFQQTHSYAGACRVRSGGTVKNATKENQNRKTDEHLSRYATADIRRSLEHGIGHPINEAINGIIERFIGSDEESQQEQYEEDIDKRDQERHCGVLSRSA